MRLMAAWCVGGCLPAHRPTPLQQDPFEYLVVPGFVNPDALEQINRDFPPLQKPRSFFLEEVTGGPYKCRFLV